MAIKLNSFKLGLGLILFILVFFIFNYKTSEENDEIAKIHRTEYKGKQPVITNNNDDTVETNGLNLRSSFINDFGEETSRDFFRYKCKNLKRLGGKPEYINKVEDKLYRIEGAWFVCMDDGVAPVQNKCNILSLGVNDDPTFDIEINQNYGCVVESFDPFIEDKLFKEIRQKNNINDEQVTIKVNDKWRFHKIGITGDLKSVTNVGKVGWITTLGEILEHSNLTNKVIDIFKMDIDYSEWGVLMNLNMDYACKYIKQFMLETHTPQINPKNIVLPEHNPLKLLRQLEKCFSLFHRDTRFYTGSKFGPYGFYQTEFQEPVDFRIELKQYKTELNLIDFMVTYGELYFLNKNFLNK